MTMPLSPKEKLRLAKLLGMLGSDHSGERDAAGMAAHRLVKVAGLTWDEVVNPPQVGWRRPEPEPDPEPDPFSWASYVSWRKTVSRLLDQRDLLTEWEIGFLNSIWQRSRLTERQSACLNDIVERVETRQARRRGHD
jgi:hypothetical protein